MVVDATRRGDIQKLKYIHHVDKHVIPTVPELPNIAAEHGHLNILSWLKNTFHEREYKWNDEVCFSAAKGGYLHILQWLRSLNPPCPWDHRVADVAIQNGDIQLLKWIRSQTPPCPLPDILPNTLSSFQQDHLVTPNFSPGLLHCSKKQPQPNLNGPQPNLNEQRHDEIKPNYSMIMKLLE